MGDTGRGTCLHESRLTLARRRHRRGPARRFCTALAGAPGGRESSVERVAARRFWRLAPVWGIAALGSIHRQIPSCSTKRATADRVDRSLFHRNGGQCVLFSSVVGASGCPIVFPRQLQRSGAAGFRSFRVSRCIERPADGSPRSGAPHRPVRRPVIWSSTAEPTRRSDRSAPATPRFLAIR